MAKKTAELQRRRDFLKLAAFTGAAALASKSASADAEQLVSPQKAAKHGGEGKMEFLRVSGSHIVDATGSNVRLRGTLEIRSGESRAFGPDHAHDVQNSSLAPAISIHAYSPSLDEMNEYGLDGSLLVPRQRRIGIAETLDEDWQIEWQKPTNSSGALTIEQTLWKARGRLHRPPPEEVYEATVNSGAILVDVRPEGQRTIILASK